MSAVLRPFGDVVHPLSTDGRTSGPGEPLIAHLRGLERSPAGSHTPVRAGSTPASATTLEAA